LARFTDHIEEHLGPVRGGVRVDEGLAIVAFADCPAAGASTMMTLGLSHHAFHQADGPNLRIEFLIACRAGMIEAFHPELILADVSETVVRRHEAPPRGTVLRWGKRFFPETRMEDLYCAPPIYFHEGLAAFDGFPEPFLPIWLIPITPAEVGHIHQHGWPAFEGLLDDADVDLLDLGRRSLVADAG
jgi:Suppressor of fused protein (SUFU)